jgi:RNA polymerase sigma-70 factor (ECF subfamily)
MRRILVDHARTQAARKRLAGDTIDMPADSAAAEEHRVVEVIAIDLALDGLAREAPRQARIVELRCFGGLSVPEVADVLGITPRTVDRDWAAARAWPPACSEPHASLKPKRGRRSSMPPAATTASFGQPSN